MNNKQSIIDLLNQGANVWNKWREENPKKLLHFNVINLRGADLSNRDLSGVNLQGIDLQGVNFENTDLSGSNLYDADLYEANLKGAKFNKATLSSAKLLELDLRGINFNEAKLDGAILQQANLSRANFSRANLMNANLDKADLSEATLCDAKLWGANLGEVKLCGANLTGAQLHRADLLEANLTGADLTNANLGGAWLRKVNFSKAILQGTSLINSQLGNANFHDAIISDCLVHGISAWGLQNLDTAQQSNLIVTRNDEPQITVGDLEVAQFVYMLLNNSKIRNIIDTITSKVVLILGRFQNMQRLQSISEEFQKRDYVPVIFNFEKPVSHTFIETVSTLAHMAKFVVADVTDPKIVLQELPHIVSSVAVPVLPLLEKGSKEPITLSDLRVNHLSLLDTCRYEDIDDLIQSFDEKVIDPLKTKGEELSRRKAEELMKSKEVQ